MENMNEERKRPPSPQKPRDAGAGSPQKVPTKTLRPMLIPVVASVTAVCILIGIISVIAGITASVAGGSELPRVRSAEDAIAVLSDRAGELGYENALSELTELHTNTVAGHSYYRLQQNYNGIPVYGRTVVYAADERGELLSVTQNIQDVPDDLDLIPTITRVQATDSIRAYLAETYPDLAWEDIPVVSLDKESLCIYSLDGNAHLAYKLCWNTVTFILDAHTAQVLSLYDTIREARATFSGSGETLDVLKLEDGTYVLKDENTGTYVFSAQGESYWNTDAATFSPEVLQIVSSQDSIFGNEDDSIADPNSIIRAENLLNCTNEIRAFYESCVGYVPIDNLILVYDDHINDRLNGGSCGGGWTKVRTLLGFGKDLSDYDPENDAKYAGLITVGTYYSDESQPLHVDVIAHEYTHVVTGRIIDWNYDSNQTNALDEAFSDIFGELFQISWRGFADWSDSGRNIANPRLTNNAVVAGENGEVGPFPSAGGNDVYKYHYSTVISHAAYKMWSGLDGIPGSAISTEDMVRLWYTSMLMLPSDADFADCRQAVTLAAEHMGMTEAQQRGIAQAFDEAGIYEEFDSELCYLVSKDFTLTVYGDDNKPFTNYRIEVLEDCGSLEIILGKQFHAVNEEPGQDVFMDLTNKSVYAVTLTNLYDPAQTVNFHIKVQKDGSDQLHLYTNFRESAGENPVTQPVEEVPAEDVTGPIESQPIESEGALDTSGEAPYYIVHWDRSYRTEDGQSGMDYYFDYVVLEGNQPACQKINEMLYQDAERFMFFYDGNSAVTDPVGNLIIGQYHAESEVIYNQNGLLCIKVYTHDAMGGNTDHVDSYSMFFNLNTGEIATLADLTGIDEETLLPQLRSIAITKLKDTYGSMLLDSAENTVSHMQLEEFDYYVYEGEIWLHFEKYSVTPGVCGAVNISTGLYLGGNGEQQPAG